MYKWQTMENLTIEIRCSQTWNRWKPVDARIHPSNTRAPALVVGARASAPADRSARRVRVPWWTDPSYLGWFRWFCRCFPQEMTLSLDGFFGDPPFSEAAIGRIGRSSTARCSSQLKSCVIQGLPCTADPQKRH